MEALNPDLQDHIERLMYVEEPKEAMDFMGLEDHDLVGEIKREKDQSALNMAVVILEHIHSRLTDQVDGYPGPAFPKNLR